MNGNRCGPAAGWMLGAALAVAAAGCESQVQLAERPVMVDTYPPPVDPATLLPREAPPPPEPKLIPNGEKTTLVYTCRYVRSEILKEAIEGLLSPEGTVESSPRLNSLVVCDAKDLVPGLLDLIQTLDRVVPQVLVEARVVEVTLDSDLEYELRYAYTHPGGTTSAFFQPGSVTLQTPGANPVTTQGILFNARIWTTEDAGQLDAFIRWLLTKGKAKLLSSPNLVVSAGDEASIITGEEVPVQSATVVSGSVSTTTQFKRVGIKLRVVPLQISGDTALLEINPEVSAVTGFTAAGPGGISNPIVAIRNVSTTASLKDGEVLTIGGLLRSEDRDIVRKVPILGDIPGVGLLFQARRNQSVKTQLIFFLRINILGQGSPHTIRFHRPGVGLQGLDEEVERLTPQPRDLEPLKVPSRGTTKPLSPESPPPAQEPGAAPPAAPPPAALPPAAGRPPATEGAKAAQP
jgi:hypothetical protein